MTMEQDKSTIITVDLDWASHIDIPNLNISMLPKSGEVFYTNSSYPIKPSKQKSKRIKKK